MARQDINIGVEGNDGTGDSIRESFRKVNENFQEVYAIFGQGGSIAFTALSDTPDALFPNTIPLVNDSGSAIQLVTLASNSALDDTASDTITFTYSQAGKLVISTAFTKLRDDQSPVIGQPMYGGLNPIGGIAEPSDEAAEALNTIHNTNLTIDDLVITKGYADRRYVSSGLPIRIAGEPVSRDGYIFEVSRYLSSFVEILSHGYDTGINGTAFVFNSIYTDPQDLQTEVAVSEMVAGRTYKITSVGLTDFTQYGADYNRVGEIFRSNASDATGNGRVKPVYFLRYVDENLLAVFDNRTGASYVSDSDAYEAGNGWIEIGATNIAEDDIHTFTDASVDLSLEGNFLADVAMPRRSIVRRQGDTMEGVLTLSDHPGELSGFGTPNGADDLQAATKFYVDQAGYSSVVNLYVSTDGDDRMVGVPPGKEGTSLQYAYRSIQKAAQRADEIIRTAEAEPGPYMQTVTRDNGADFAEVTFRDIVTPVYENTRYLLQQNRTYLTKEISGFVKWQFPDFVYNIETCERDVGLMIDAIAFDINRGLNANYLSQLAAERYYSSISGRFAIIQQNAETVGAIQELRNIISAVLSNTLYREKGIDSIALGGEALERARVTTATNHGFVDGEQVVFKDMGGMLEIEDQTAYIKVITDQIFELYTDPDLLNLWDISSYTGYTLGGRCGRVYQDRIDDFNSVKVQQFFYTPPGWPTQDDLDAKDAIVNPTSGKIQQIIRIINDLDDRTDTVYGSNYKIVLNNGSTNAYVDQANPDNTDTLPGKIMVGKISGAKGRIVKVTQNDGTENNNDSFEMIQLNGVDFVVGEPVEFGNFVKERQVTLIVEAGVYEEDYPIRIGSNVSLSGDDFRRCIIRPKKRVSQSKWADTYFFRDLEFDGIPVATKGAPFYNQIGELQGYFGRHYLTDVERPKNVGILAQNPGNYDTAAKILRDNKQFIQQEVLYYIDSNAQDLIYNKATCQRDLGLILDAVRYDAALGTNYNAITAGLAYRRANNSYNLNYEQAYTLAAINEEKSEVLALSAVSSDSTAFGRATSAFDEVVDIIENNTPDALTFPVPGTLPTTDADDAASRLQNNRTFIQKEIIAWIAENYPFFDYDSTKCERDVGYIVDGLTYDILYGGNSATQTVARSYFEGTRNQLGVNETLTTIEAYTRLKEVVDEIVRGATVTKSTGNEEAQDTTGSNATSTEGNALQALIEDNIIQVLDDESITNLPNVTYPNLGWVAAGTRSASDAINSNRTTIINNVISFLDGEITGNFVYDTAKCARDVGLIIDALALDFERGGNEFSLETQGQYYTNYILAYDASPGTPSNFGGQASITSAAIGYIATLASDLFNIVTPTENVGIEADVSNGPAEAGTGIILGDLINIIRFAFDKNYNPPKRNDDNGVDVFLMGDASRIANCTVQGHGGFMCVLDPDGQILTKSPYIQVGSSFSKSDNAKRFRGGMYVDAYTGNIPAYIPENITTTTYSGPGKISNYELWIRSEVGQGLFIRPPQLPCPFYVDGRRYQVNAISDYDSGNGWCKIYLDNRSNDGDGYDETQFDDGLYYRNIYLQTAGNRSMLGNDFTQINDLGYALVCNNGALSEMVSMFTYYCQVAYYAKNGSEIRSTAGSNGYGNFGLVAEGADPNEIPDQVTLRDPMVVPAKAYTSVATPNALNDTSLYVTDMRTPPTAQSLITIDHGGSIGTLNYIISSVQNMSDSDNDGIDGNAGGSDIVATGGVYSNRVYRLNLRGDDQAATDFFPSLRQTVPNGTYIEYRHNNSQIFEGVLDPAELKTRPSTAINFDESDAVTYRSLSFANTDAFSYPLATDEILAGMEIGYDFIDLEIDPDNLTGGYGDTQGDTKIAIKNTGLTPPKIIRLLRDIAGLQPGDAGYAGGMVFTWKGKSHQVVGYTEGAFNYITIQDAGTNISAYGGTGLSTGILTTDKLLRCGLNSGSTAEITIKISLVRATGHDFTQIGTGGFNTSNYPNVIYGLPTVGDVSEIDYHTDAPTATSAQVWERRKGRVFWMSTDQNGWFRVGKFFSVDQGTGDINVGGNIGISGATSLAFLRGVSVNEFSADDSFSDFSGSAVPTERAIGSYINRVLGWNVQSGVQIQEPFTGNRIGPGFLPLSGQSQMEGDIDMGNNNITNLALPGTDGTAATNKNYVDEQVSSFDQIEDLRNTELNNVAVNDLLVATGKKRLILTPISGGTWTVGQTIQNGGATKTGTVVDVETSVDPIEGNINIVTYTPVTGVFGIGENLTNGTATATVIDGPIDEWANAVLKKTGAAGASTWTDIDITVERAAAGTTINFQHVPDSIKNADVNSAAAIAQSKLNMQNANTFDESDATNGWDGTATKVQADLGLAKFSDENFETSSGYVRIKNGGVIFAEMQDIDQYKLYGRQSSGSGDPQEVAYSDAIKYGGGLEDRDFNNSEWTATTVTKLVFATPVTVSNGNRLEQNAGAIYGTVQGDVYLGTTVYLTSVTGIFSVGNGAVTNASAVPTENLGTPTTATVVNNFGKALIKTDDGYYATTTISTGTSADTIVRRNASGKINASVLQLDSYDILDISGTTLVAKTPAGDTFLTAPGPGKATGEKLTTLDIPIRIGSITNNATNDKFGQSLAQAGTTANNGKGFVGAQWMYTSFIEALSQSGGAANATSGIGLGVGNGYTAHADDVLVFVTKGTTRVAISDTTLTVKDTSGVNKFTVTASNGNTSIAGTLGVSGATTLSSTLAVTSTATFNGNVDLGNATSDTVTFTGRIDSTVNPSANNTYNLGADALRWNTIYATTFSGTATTAKYADLAEKYVGDEAYQPGTVLVFGGDKEVTVTNAKGDRRVAGVVSTNPAYLMNSELDAVNTVSVALAGRVPCNVLGRVQKGDLLVTSAIPGYAVVDNEAKVGTVIGKALESKDTDGKGTIEIVVGRA